MHAIEGRAGRAMLRDARAAGLDVSLCGGRMVVQGWPWQEDLALVLREHEGEIVPELEWEMQAAFTPRELVALDGMRARFTTRAS